MAKYYISIIILIFNKNDCMFSILIITITQAKCNIAQYS